MKSTICKDIINSFVSIAKGMWVTAKNYFRPAVTELYPEQKPVLPENYRGMPSLPVNPETGLPKCIGCGICAKMCPEQIIKVTVDKSDPKNRKPVEFTIDISRCMWCRAVHGSVSHPGFEAGEDVRAGMLHARRAWSITLEDLIKLGGVLPAEPEKEEKPEEQASS